MASATASETTVPEKKNGSALAKNTAASVPVSVEVRERMNTRQKHHHKAVQNRQCSQLEIDVSAPAGDDIRKYTASAQSEECDGDSEKSEMIIEDYREDAR